MDFFSGWEGYSLMCSPISFDGKLLGTTQSVKSEVFIF